MIIKPIIIIFFCISNIPLMSLAQLSPSLFVCCNNRYDAYLKMDLKSDFFDFFQPICFWKAETKLEMNLLEFL